MPWLHEVKGVLQMWYAGEQMGPATARLLFGDVASSGKLTHTFPQSEGDLPTAGDPERLPGTLSDGSIERQPGNTEPRQVEFAEGLEVGYRWYEAQGIKPLFEFGHGLTYTRFKYDRLRVTPQRTDGRKEIRIRFRVENAGRRTGTEVAQAYVELPARTGEPSKRLIGWKRVMLRPGESRNATIRISAADLKDLHLLQYWNPGSGRWTTAKGFYEISVGSSFDTSLEDRFRIR